MGRKTRDGLKLTKILKAAREIGARVRTGTKHPHSLEYPGLRACPVATSTDARKMVAPWIAKATGYSPTKAYTALKQGSW